MKAVKSKQKAPKKAERIASNKNVISESYIALFGDDITLYPENLYKLFDIKNEAQTSLQIDLHNGKLYLLQGNESTPVSYDDMPQFLRRGGKGSGKYKHLSVDNWQSLTDKIRAEELFLSHNPAPLKRAYPTGVTPPDIEAYYIKRTQAQAQSCVYLRNVGDGQWRVFYAKSSAPLAFEAYACSEYSLNDILHVQDRRSKKGQIDCCDRLLGTDEMQYLSAFMPDEHALKRTQALPLAADDTEQILVNAYYWKQGKCVACADEAYILSLYDALEEIARCSVILEFPEEAPTDQLPAEKTPEQILQETTDEAETPETVEETAAEEVPEETQQEQPSPEAQAPDKEQKEKKQRFSFFKKKKSGITQEQEKEADKAPAAESEPADVAAQAQETSSEEDSVFTPTQEALSIEESAAELLAETVETASAPKSAEQEQTPEEATDETDMPEIVEEASAEKESADQPPAEPSSQKLEQIPTSYTALAQEVLELEQADTAPQQQSKAGDAPQAQEQTLSVPVDADDKTVVAQPKVSQSAAVQVAFIPAKAGAVSFDLDKLISAYAVAGRKKSKVREEIRKTLPNAPLIVPITALGYSENTLVYVSKQAYNLCGNKIIPFAAMADKTVLLPEEHNRELRHGVMVKTVVSHTKAYIPVFADFKTAEQMFGKSELFGVFTLKNLVSHISRAQSIEGITVHPGVINLKFEPKEFEQE